MIRDGRDRPTSTRPRTRSSPPSSTTSPSGTRRASRCWSARRASRSPSGCPSLLLRKGIPHEVLNAKQHAREAAIIADAGRKGAVTIATNMAGRGTDIMLGGNPEFIADTALRERGLSPAETPEEYEAAWPDALEKAKAETRQGARGGRRARRPVRAGHRAARVAAHRQPAARPLRPAGRPGRVALLPLPRRRPDGPVQRRAGRGDDEPAAAARGRPDRGEDGLEGDPVGADAGGAAELRDPQERPQVRRGA